MRGRKFPSEKMFPTFRRVSLLDRENKIKMLSVDMIEDLDRRINALEDAIEQPTDKMFRQIQEQNRNILTLKELLLHIGKDIKIALDYTQYGD